MLNQIHDTGAGVTCLVSNLLYAILGIAYIKGLACSLNSQTLFGSFPGSSLLLKMMPELFTVNVKPDFDWSIISFVKQNMLNYCNVLF